MCSGAGRLTDCLKNTTAWLLYLPDSIINQGVGVGGGGGGWLPTWFAAGAGVHMAAMRMVTFCVQLEQVIVKQEIKRDNNI